MKKENQSSQVSYTENNQRIIEPNCIIDTELYELLVTLSNTKVTHRNICARMREQGIPLASKDEEYFDKDINGIITATSCLAATQLEYEIKKGGSL